MTSSSNNGSMMDWQSGIGTMQDGINRVLETGEQSDVEFMVGKQLWDEKSQKWIPVEEPKLFKVHKFVLSIRSPVFATQFGFNNGQQQNNEPIKVIDITVSAFEALLAFLYKNDLSLINSDNFLEVYSAARKYLLQVLVEKCNELAPKMLKWKNSVDVWRTAKLHEDKVLIGHCLKFFDNNIRTVEEGDVYFWSLKRDELEELLKRDTLRTNWESNLFYFLEYWALKQCKNEGIDKPTGQEKRDKMGTLINVVRFPLIPPAIFTKYIVPTGILTAEEVALIFIHYSEDASVKFKQLNPLPFSSQPRAIRPQGVHNKLVDKNFVEREKMQLITNNVLLENKKKESEEKVKELEKKAKENEEKIKQFEKKAKENEKTIKQLEKKAKENEETVKRLEKNVPKTNTSLRAGGKRKKGM